eukprot:scaffold116044_cov15-Tisochrysis_lutea.AAC.2
MESSSLLFCHLFQSSHHNDGFWLTQDNFKSHCWPQKSIKKNSISVLGYIPPILQMEPFLNSGFPFCKFEKPE